MSNAARRNRMQQRHAESAKPAPALVEDREIEANPDVDVTNFHEQNELEEERLAPPPKAEDIDIGSLNRAIRQGENLEAASDEAREVLEGIAKASGRSIMEVLSDADDAIILAEAEEVETVDQFDVAEQTGESVLDVSPTTEDIGIAPEHQGTTAAPAAEPDQSATVVPGAASQKKVKVLPTMYETLVKAREANPERYANVVRVTEQTQKGEPKRVVIRCSDPQTKQVNGEDVSVCEEYREIAVQDLFQVRCCLPCADRKVRKARRNKTKERNKELRKLVAANKASR